MEDDVEKPYDLVIGDRAYSSWSLRGWLLFSAFNIPYKLHIARLYSDELPLLLRQFSPARTAPTIKTPDGVVVTESLAIAEELASRHPDRGIWPAAPKARAIARSLAAEMHAGFLALRNHCPMNLRVSYQYCNPPQAVLDDLGRIQTIWTWAFAHRIGVGPWLCGEYSAADVFFAPVAARIAGYNLPVDADMAAYVAAHLAHPEFRAWRALALSDGPHQPIYDRDYPTRPWPGVL